MRHLERTSIDGSAPALRGAATSILAVAVTLALALAPVAASAQTAPGTKPEGHGHGHGHDAYKPGTGPQGGGGPKHGGGPGVGKDKPGPAGAAAAPAKPAATMPPSPEVAKAVDGMMASCPKALELRERISAVADQRKAAIAAIRTAQNEAKKQLRTVTAEKAKIERAVKKPGTDTAPMFEKARAAHEAAVTQSATVAAESQKLRASEDELAAIAGAADEAANACAAAEVTLRTAAAEARKAAGEARREAVKARALARMPPVKALEAARAKQATDLEALKKQSDEAKGALDSLRTVAAAAPPSAAPAPAAEKKPAQ
jgi:hypothetical protein